MKRQVFFSFHYSEDIWRVGQVRNMGLVESQNLFSDNGWEKVRLKSESAIKAWIDNEMKMRSCVVVLIGNWNWSFRVAEIFPRFMVQLKRYFRCFYFSLRYASIFHNLSQYIRHIKKAAGNSNIIYDIRIWNSLPSQRVKSISKLFYVAFCISDFFKLRHPNCSLFHNEFNRPLNSMRIRFTALTMDATDLQGQKTLNTH